MAAVCSPTTATPSCPAEPVRKRLNRAQAGSRVSADRGRIGGVGVWRYRARVHDESEAADIAALRTEYRRLAMEWHDARNEPAQANRLFDRLHALSKDIKGSSEGQAAILSLLEDPVTAVRLAAATYALAFSERRAVQALEEIERDDGSLYAVSAKWTLRSHWAGTLNLDW